MSILSKQRPPMQPPRLSSLLAGVMALLGATHTGAETMCRPTLTVEQVRFSEPGGQQRLWSAIVSVDASSCVTSWGPFYVNFVRLKEMAPDVLFSGEFTWEPGEVEVWVVLWL